MLLLNRTLQCYLNSSCMRSHSDTNFSYLYCVCKLIFRKILVNANIKTCILLIFLISQYFKVILHIHHIDWQCTKCNDLVLAKDISFLTKQNICEAILMPQIRRIHSLGYACLNRERSSKFTITKFLNNYAKNVKIDKPAFYYLLWRAISRCMLSPLLSA